MNKILTITVILSLFGVLVVPIVNANLIDSQKETVKLTCTYFTLNGIEKIEKEVIKNDAEHLSKQMKESKSDKIASELNRLELLSNNMNIDQVKDLLSGEYGRKHFRQLQKEIKIPYTESDKRQNLFCAVSGDAVDGILTNPTLAILVDIPLFITIFLIMLDQYLIRFDWYPTLPSPLPDVGLIFFLALFFMGVTDLIMMALYFQPFKANMFSYAQLEDYTPPPNVNANVKTFGLLGKWWMYSPHISLSMIGFLGLWISYHDGVNNPACEFMGFALYVKAEDKQ